MTVNSLLKTLPIQLETPDLSLEKAITGVYCGDLLSLVMANAREGDVWITIQNHINVMAVASLVGVSAIIVVEGISVDPDVIEKAKEEEIAVFTTQQSAYDIARICAKELSL